VPAGADRLEANASAGSICRRYSLTDPSENCGKVSAASACDFLYAKTVFLFVQEKVE
jgi:hypothetical protein